MESNCSNVPRGPYYPAAEPDEAVFTYNESWEKEKNTTVIYGLPRKSICLVSVPVGQKKRESQTIHARWSCAMQPCKKGPGPTAAACSPPRRTPACSGTCPRSASAQSSRPGFPSWVSASHLGSNVHHVHQSREVELGDSLSLLGGSEELLQVFESVRQCRALLQLWNLVCLLTPSLGRRKGHETDFLPNNSHYRFCSYCTPQSFCLAQNHLLLPPEQLAWDYSPKGRWWLGWRAETGGGRGEDPGDPQGGPCPQLGIGAAALQTWIGRARAPVRWQPGFVSVTSALH